MTTEIKSTGPVSPAGFRLMAGIAAVIGFAASAVAARFFMLAVNAQEVDPSIRWALTFVAGLFVVSEVAVFTLAGLLDKVRHKSLRARLVFAGCVLLTFEVLSIYASQVVIASAQDARAQASQTRAGELRTTIERQRQTSAALTETGRLSGQSVIASSRASGVAALERAAQLDASTLALSSELAQIESQQVTTQSGVFGQAGAVVMGAVRAVLVSSIGLMFFGLAGVLWRMAHEEVHAEFVVVQKPETLTPNGLPSHFAGVLMPAPETEPIPALDRYESIRAAVLDGSLKPSVRAIQAVHGGGTGRARDDLGQLLVEGLIESQGKGMGYRRCG